VIGFQFLAAACATLALYDLGRQLGGRLAGVLAAAFFVIDYDIARWHLYLLTDSLYISLVPIAVWAVHWAAERSGGAYVLAGTVLGTTALIRPNGWLLIPIAVVYWIARSPFSGRAKRAVGAGVVLLCVGGAAAFAAMQFGGTSAAPAQDGSEPLPFAQVMTLRERLDPAQMPVRVFKELSHVQPSFSRRHVVMVFAMLALVYPLAVIGFVRSREQPLARLLAVIIAGHLAVVAITFSDHDGRYLLYFFPLLLVYAGSAAVSLRRKRPALTLESASGSR
jgi:4-amino-4-deoxy-L-arabinose transferase-like glycosyltransferase